MSFAEQISVDGVQIMNNDTNEGHVVASLRIVLHSAASKAWLCATR